MRNVSALETVKATLDFYGYSHYTVRFKPEEGIAVRVGGREIIIPSPNADKAQAELIAWLKKIS